MCCASAYDGPRECHVDPNTVSISVAVNTQVNVGDCSLPDTTCAGQGGGGRGATASGGWVGGKVDIRFSKAADQWNRGDWMRPDQQLLSLKNADITTQIHIPISCLLLCHSASFCTAAVYDFWQGATLTVQPHFPQLGPRGNEPFGSVQLHDSS